MEVRFKLQEYRGTATASTNHAFSRSGQTRPLRDFAPSS